jgi:excisionase family DNA binding protein
MAHGPRTDDSDLLAPSHAQPILGVGNDRIRALVREGVLPAIRLPDGRMLLRRADVLALAEKRAQARAAGSR